MELEIKKKGFQVWMMESGINPMAPVETIVERYFNEVLCIGVFNNMIELVQQLEQTDAYENGVSMSELLENEAQQLFEKVNNSRS